MENALNQRIADVVKYLIFSNVALDKKDLAQKMGYNASSFSQIINGRVPISEKFIERLIRIAPNIEEKWILTGEGQMTRSLSVPSSPITEIIDKDEIPAEIVEEIKAEVIEEIKVAKSVPVVPSDIANTAQINVRKFIEKKADELERISPSDLVQRADGAERVRKASMMPTFMPGDVVFIEFLDDKTKIIDGHIYYFDTKTRPTMIRRVKFEGNKLRLIAENPMYGDIIMNYDDILNIADIVGMFRSSFGNQYVEIEEMRKKKDSQIDKLIEHIGDLIAVVKDKK